MMSTQTWVQLLTHVRGRTRVARTPVHKQRGVMHAVIGDRIAESHDAKGMTQVELALALGIHPMTVSYYERNAWPVPAKRLAQIADVLGDPSLLQAHEHHETLR